MDYNSKNMKVSSNKKKNTLLEQDPVVQHLGKNCEDWSKEDYQQFRLKRDSTKEEFAFSKDQSGWGPSFCISIIFIYK